MIPPLILALIFFDSLILLIALIVGKTVEALNAAGLRSTIRVGVGGAPLIQKFAAEIGADFYCEDAYKCVETGNTLLN